jgi:carbonic anhydrase
MAGRGLRDKYDHVVLAGASLGAITSKYPDWGRTFWEHLGVAIQLHHVKTVIVLDHRDCGAYKTILGEDLAPDPAKEMRVHAKQLTALRTAIRKRHANLQVELLLMALDGTVAPVA